ncbi:hypothetical protein [Streptomyces sp. NBC_00299]|uniref:hypothetical protein n=1 Tax=Streptomyces sp. NBC_00299 TaxID=2975705 RepID=UPI002E2B1C9E|nr:hypothetical protein [Streptomyces sp. NBC_00299]
MGSVNPVDTQVTTFTDGFFKATLQQLRLTVDQIMAQSLAELQTSLETVNTAIEHPDSFPVARVELAAKAGTVLFVLADKAENAQMELGILPTLLERKTLILERINSLRPAEQIKDFRQEVSASVTDPETREHLLKVLDEHAAMEKERSERLDRERAEATAGLATEATNLTTEVAFTELKHRTDTLEKLADKLDSEKVTKYDVVTITFAILAAIGGMTTAVLALIKWVIG